MMIIDYIIYPHYISEIFQVTIYTISVYFPACCTGGRGLGPQLVFGPRVKPTGKTIGK